MRNGGRALGNGREGFARPDGIECRQDGAISAPAVRLGISHQQVLRWERSGLSAWQADAIACLLGLHPVELWPDWYEHTPWEELAA